MMKKKKKMMMMMRMLLRYNPLSCVKSSRAIGCTEVP
jgi:hypothetical protein